MTTMGDRGEGRLFRLAAFADDPTGGNPAGVWLGTSLPSPGEMQRIAREVGYSETAFVAPLQDRVWRVRYYSPEAEVSFCGHATIATGVVLGEREGEGAYRLSTAVGDVPVVVSRREGRTIASLTSVEPRHEPAGERLLDGALRTLRWRRDQLDPTLPPARAYAGAWHLVLAVSERATLDALDYDFDALKALMLADDLTTLQIVWRESASSFHARDPFPVGGVVEDPATGAAAAALGGYLRDAGLLDAPATFTIRQGEVMGRPSRLEVSVPTSGGITVTGTAVNIGSEDSGSSPPPPAAVVDGSAAAVDRSFAAVGLARDFLRRVWTSPADLDAIDELMTEDYVIHSAGTTVSGRDTFRGWVQAFQRSLVGATNEVLDVFASPDGDRVTALWTCRGANRGIFGLPPDGRPIEFSGIAVWRVHEGRLAECWVERSALEAVRSHERSRDPEGPGGAPAS